MSSTVEHIEPKLGEGIFLVKDVSKILGIDYDKTYRWIAGYWGNELEENVQYTFGEVGNRAINFLSLIEFHTFFRLKEKGATTQQIRKLHRELSARFRTRYPFATDHNIFVEDRKSREGNESGKNYLFYEYFGSLFKMDDKKQQPYFKFFEQFLDKIEFENHLARRFFPLTGSRNVVVDPNHQFGQPIIWGTNIKTQTLFSLYQGGETLENISNLYGISLDKVRDAIAFQRAA